jgi:hypothetical protein
MSLSKEEIVFSFSERKAFSSADIQTGSVAHPASYPMGTVGSFPGIKRPRHEADRSPPTSAEVKNCGAIPPLPHISSRLSA